MYRLHHTIIRILAWKKSRFTHIENCWKRSKKPCSSDYDRLWHAAGKFTAADLPRPNWSGFIQDVVQGDHPSKSDVLMLPITDLNPNDET